MKKLMVSAAVVLTAALGITSAVQAAWPEKPIKLVVPFKAGGTSDQTGRVFQASIKENNLLSQPITIVNVGGHYSIGSRQVMETPADGYNFLLIHIALMGGEGSGALDFGWRDFEPVAASGEFCLFPMVRKDSGINSVEELLANAKSKPDSLIFGANLGAINHLAGVMLQEEVPGAKFRFVQIGGGTANYTALTGGHTNATVLSGAEVLKFTRLPDGSVNPESQIKPLAYTGAKRFGPLNHLPTMKELGYKTEFCIKSWWFAPKGTPKEAIDGFANAMKKATQTDRYKKFLASKGFANVFLQDDALMKDLKDTWTAIEPVAKLAKKK